MEVRDGLERRRRQAAEAAELPVGLPVEVAEVAWDTAKMAEVPSTATVVAPSIAVEQGDVE